MIQDIQINLSVSGVTTLDILEDEVIIRAYYDGNNTFYHNLHKIFLNYDFDIVSCQIWFSQIGQNETEAELILAGAIKTLTITPKSTKSLIVLAIDKTLIGAERFFAESVSGNLSFEEAENSFVTTEVFDETIDSIYNDLPLTAERIVQNSINPDTSNSTIELTDNRASFYVSTNLIDYVINEVYADWDLNQQPLTLIDTPNVPLTPTQYGALLPDYPRPIYTLLPFHNLNLQNLNFYVCRNFEGAYLTPNFPSPFPLIQNYMTAYYDRFGIILDTSLLGNEYIKIDMTNINVISGSPMSNNNVFPLETSDPTDRPTRKYPQSAFKIWKDNNTTRDNIIFSIPLTNIELDSTKTQQNLNNLSFWINKQGWYFGSQEETKKLFTPITKSIDSFRDTLNVDLEDGMNDTIVSFSFVVKIPSDGNTYIRDITLNNSSLIEEINFVLKIMISGVPAGTNYQIKNNATTIYTYITTNIDRTQINVATFQIQANSTSITVTPIIQIENQNYYDWAYDSNNYALSVFRMTKEPSTVLTTEQYNSLEPDQNLILPLDLSNLRHQIFLKNLTFFAVRNIYRVFDQNDSLVYITPQYANRMLIEIINVENETWNFFSMKNVCYKQNIPVANNQMFPLSTSSTVNYKNLEPVIEYNGDFGIGRFSIFTFLNEASERYFTFPIAQDLLTKTIIGDVNISGKFWFGNFNQSGQPQNIYQCLESEKDLIVRANGATNTILDIPVDSSFVNKIFYPVINQLNSLTYNWVYPNKKFVLNRQFLASPLTNPKIYKFSIRLYCVYGSDVSAGGTSGMVYNYNSQFFVGQPSTFVNNTLETQKTFEVQIKYFTDATNTEFVENVYIIPYPRFFMNDLRVIDLEFEVNEAFFHLNDAVDAKKRITYLGQKEIKL